MHLIRLSGSVGRIWVDWKEPELLHLSSTTGTTVRRWTSWTTVQMQKRQQKLSKVKSAARLNFVEAWVNTQSRQLRSFRAHVTEKHKLLLLACKTSP